MRLMSIQDNFMYVCINGYIDKSTTLMIEQSTLLAKSYRDLFTVPQF